MRTRLGIGIGRNTVRLVSVRGGQLRWAAEVERKEGEALSETLCSLLVISPLRRWPRPVAIVAVGPTGVQTKRLSGLPPLSDPREMSQLVQGSMGRFFLRSGVPLATSPVRLIRAGEAWAAAFEAPLVREIEDACRTARLRLRAIVPTVAVLGLGLDGDQVAWRDGDACVDVTLANGELKSVRRIDGRANEVGTLELRPCPALAQLGEQAYRYADAYGAAVSKTSSSLALRRGRSGAGEPGVPRWRLTAAGIALACSVLAAVLASGMAAVHARGEASGRLTQLAATRRAADAAEQELGRISDALMEVAAFERAHLSMSMLLAELTRALPEGTALLAIRVDSTSGNLVALAPRAASVLAPLERVRAIVAPEIVGPVTREAVGSRELERVTIRFTLGAPSGSRRTASESSP